jgi:hypothetical protein
VVAWPIGMTLPGSVALCGWATELLCFPARVAALDGECQLIESRPKLVVCGQAGGDFVVASSEVLREGMTGGEGASRAKGLQTAHRSEPGFRAAVVVFDPVVGVMLRVVQCGGDELVEDSWVGRRSIRGDLDGDAAGGESPAEELPGGGNVTPAGQPRVDDLPRLVDRPAQVRPPGRRPRRRFRRRTIGRQAPGGAGVPRRSTRA